LPKNKSNAHPPAIHHGSENERNHFCTSASFVGRQTALVTNSLIVVPIRAGDHDAVPAPTMVITAMGIAVNILNGLANQEQAPCAREGTTAEGREANQSHAFDSPCRARAGHLNSPAIEERRKTRDRAPGRRRRPTIDDLETPPVSRRSDIRVRGALRAFLESERDVLLNTQSLLVCVAQAMHVEHLPTGQYYPDVVGPAQDLLKGRVCNLDELLLHGRLPGGE
jgi:hypothetical protein